MLYGVFGIYDVEYIKIKKNIKGMSEEQQSRCAWQMTVEWLWNKIAL